MCKRQEEEKGKWRRGPKVTEENCLAARFPEIAKEWHPNANGDRTPYNTGQFSNFEAVWICEKHGDYKMIVSNRTTRGSGCPYCVGKKAHALNCLGTIYPEIAKEWHPSRNGDLTPYDVVPGSNKKVVWSCKKHGEYKMSISCRICQNQCCPYCAGQKAHALNCLGTMYPEIAKEWHPNANGDRTPYNTMPGSNFKAVWICEKHGDYRMRVRYRTSQGCGCPECSRSKGEIKIREILEKEFIQFKPQEIIQIQNKALKFDMCVEGKVLIEYDGIQHFEPRDFAGKGKEFAEKLFEQGIVHDNLKNQHCIENKIPLLRIPYWHFKNLEIIIKELISNLNSDNLYDIVTAKTAELLSLDNPYLEKAS